jgi:diguanylate cyclase (GGDEF)-like protein
VIGIDRADGTRAWISLSTRAIHSLSGDKPSSVVVSFADITEKRSFQQQLEHQAFHDPLTGLPNRQLFMDRLHHALELARHRGERLAVAFVDLDRFKAVNDALGHEAGDCLLAEIGRRLAATLRGSDLVARLGGDEFCAILTGVADANAAQSIAQRMLAALAPALEIGTRSFDVTASIGVALYPDHSTDAAALLRYADTAMYQVKATSKNGVGLFAPA